MRKRLISTLAGLFLTAGLAMAQTVVSGTVVSSDDGEPAIGATIRVEGSKEQAVTDVDGNFRLTTNVK